MPSKILIALWGESFRSGSQMTRTRGTGDYLKRQRLASNSHIKLIEHIESNCSSKCDLLINSFTLNPKDDGTLLSWYDKNHALQYKLHHNLLGGETKTLNNTYDKIVENIDDYHYVLMIRLDLYLKKYFINNFSLDPEKIVFGHIDLNGTNIDTTSFGVCQQIMLFPYKFFYVIKDKLVYDSAHNIFTNLISCNKNLRSSIKFFVNTLHLCSTDLGWNPLYLQVGRDDSDRYDANAQLYYDTEDLILKRDINKAFKFWEPHIHQDGLNENLKSI